ncbi:MAG: hypothetical protein AB7J28_15495 [Hyphomonadaceae bacterium]
MANEATDLFIMPLPNWEPIDIIPAGHTALFPGGWDNAGILYKDGDPPMAVAFLWGGNGPNLPGFRADIQIGRHPAKASGNG